MKAIVSFALVASSLAQFDFGSFKMPSLGGSKGSSSDFSMPSLGGSSGSSSGFSMPSLGGSTGDSSFDSAFKSIGDSFSCVESKCESALQACGNDSACAKANKCVQQCGKTYDDQSSDDYKECASDCASGMKNNKAFQDFSACQGNCAIEAGEMGMDCFKNQCATQWKACQASAACQKDMACSNTCFGYDVCLQDCEEESTNSEITALLNCQIQCIAKEVGFGF